jgi:16S rRNA (guanine527-N7)-methyltransferase
LKKEEKDALRSFAREWGIELTEAHLRLFSIHMDELWEWNQRVNLVGASTRERIHRELLLDSLIPSPFVPETGRYLDVGSGAGFPAVPLKICRPHLETHLVEANSKRASFLKQIIRLTGLKGVQVIRGRIEHSGDLLHPEGYHLVTARAVAGFPQTLEWCVPHLLPEGMWLSFQGAEARQRVEGQEDRLRAYGLFLHRSVSYTLPGKEGARQLLIYRKGE